MKHYIAVLMPQPEGWRVYIPDFPECRASAKVVDEAVRQARGNVREFLRARGDRTPPRARSLGEIQEDKTWAMTRAIQWDQAVISLMDVDPE